MARHRHDVVHAFRRKAQGLELPIHLTTARNRPIAPFRLSSISEPMSHCSAAADGTESYDAINLKVPPAREVENWEAGQNPALPPQRWWSEAWRKKATGPTGLGRCHGVPETEPLQSPETSLGHIWFTDRGGRPGHCFRPLPSGRACPLSVSRTAQG